MTNTPLTLAGKTRAYPQISYLGRCVNN